MRIGLAGDWHQRFPETQDAIQLLGSAGVKKVLHVGDFGFGGDKRGVNYLNKVHGWAEAASLKIYVTPGNHEDYTYVKSVLQANSINEFAPARGRVQIIPRAHRWKWGDRRFVSLGGAGSVDRMWRLTAGNRAGATYWWASEEISEEDVDATIAGGIADVMITHEGPYYPTLDDRLVDNPHGFPAIDLEWADMSRERLHAAVHGVMPKLLVHGHHHFHADTNRIWSEVDGRPGTMRTNSTIGRTRILSLNKEMDPGSLAVLDTTDLSIEMLN